MAFCIGDKVVHWSYGLGEIVGIEEKVISDHITNCYVFGINNMMIWIPVDDLQQHSLRVPTPPEEFKNLFAILTSPNEKLQTDRILRRNQLTLQMKDGTLSSLCQVIRDLTLSRRVGKLGDQERGILDRAVHSLLIEWSYSLGISINQAEENMTRLMAT